MTHSHEAENAATLTHEQIAELSASVASKPALHTIVEAARQLPEAIARAENAATVIDRINREAAEWRERAQTLQRDYAALCDKVNGTPCAEIRWQDERTDLLAQTDWNAALRDASAKRNEELESKLRVAERSRDDFEANWRSQGGRGSMSISAERIVRAQYAVQKIDPDIPGAIARDYARAILEADDMVREERERADDKIDGLEADLDSALDVLWRRGDDGAREWVRMNYREKIEGLERPLRSRITKA